MDEIVHNLWLALRSIAGVVLSGFVVSYFGFVLRVVFPETVELVDTLIEFQRLAMMVEDFTMWGWHIWVF